MESILRSGNQNITQIEAKDTHAGTSFESENSVTAKKKSLQAKSIDTFLSDDYQYIRVGSFFGRLTWDNHFTEIKSSCYYNNRKKAQNA